MDNKKKVLELVNEIKYCKNCFKAIESSKLKINVKNDWDFYSLSFRPKIMMVMQNPGEWDEETREYVNGAEDIVEKIRRMQHGLTLWLATMNRNFSEKFFKLVYDKCLNKKINDIDEIGLKEPEDKKKIYDKIKYYENVKLKYLEDFYFTDVFKFSTKTKNLDTKVDDKTLFESCTDHFEKEMKILKPTIIFIFSTRSWEWFNKKYKLEPINSKIKGKLEKVTNSHGYPFKLNEKTFIIPLAHFVQRVYNNTLRESYIDYLKEGLNELKKEINH